jgi:alpha-1,2-mannosyltransferase
VRAGVVRRLGAVPSAKHAIGLLGLSLLAFVVVLAVLTPSFTDLSVYRAEGLALRNGLDLYGPLPDVDGVNTYPPFAALLFLPTTFLPTAALKFLSVVGNLTLVFVVSWQSLRLVRGGGPGLASASCVLAAVALWAEPVTTTIRYGQINLLLLALVLWDFNLPPDSGRRGIGVGLAASLKVTPAILIVYLVLTGRFRAAATSVAVFLATMTVTLAVDAHATWSYWTDGLFDLGRAGRLENSINQSVRGWLVRADHTRDTRPTELVLVLVVLVAGLACARLAERHLGDTWGLLAAGVTGLLVSPISWSHHWVYCIPVVTLLWYQARPYALVALAVFCSRAVWAVPHGDAAELHLTGVQIALSGWYVLFGLGFLALTAFRTHAALSRSRTGRSRAGPGSSADQLAKLSNMPAT